MRGWLAANGLWNIRKDETEQKSGGKCNWCVFQRTGDETIAELHISCEENGFGWFSTC